MLIRLHLLLLMLAAAGCLRTKTPDASLSEAVERTRRQALTQDPTPLLSGGTDPRHSGHYLDIDRAMTTLGISRAKAHAIQRTMRREATRLAGGPSAVAQRPHVRAALALALRRELPEPDVEPTWAEGDLVLAFELDDVLASQWYLYGTSLGTFTVAERDVRLELVDDVSGDSLARPSLQVSGPYVLLRPGLGAFLRRLAALPRYRGFYVVTDKDEDAALALVERWRAEDPGALEGLRGVLARDHLRLDLERGRAVKDLRLVDPSLRHVVLFDPDVARVMQPERTVFLPAFNADVYLTSTGDAELAAIRRLNEGFLAHLAGLAEKGVLPLGPAAAEPLLLSYLQSLRDSEKVAVSLDVARSLGTFAPSYHAAERRPAPGTFPAFRAFKLVDGREIAPD